MIPQASSQGISRREWMLHALQAAGAAAITPVLKAGENWTPQFLSSEQNETLIALGERIIPGSAAAQCNRVIDLILAIEAPKTKEQFVNSLQAFYAEAQTRHKAAFRQLEPQEQDAILTEACQENSRLHSEFGAIKEWMADAYWTSRQGLQDLGANGQLAWPSFPGCPHNNAAA